MKTTSVKRLKIINTKLSVCVCMYHDDILLSQTQPKLLNNLSKHRKPLTRLISNALM